jgi:hypothetical protein
VFAVRYSYFGFVHCIHNKLAASEVIALYSCFCRVVGLKGVQPRAADTTAAVCSFDLQILCPEVIFFTLQLAQTCYGGHDYVEIS